MGYYTRFQIKAVDTTPGAERPVLDAKFFNSLKLLDLDPDDQMWEEAGDERFLLAGGEEYKWYDHDVEMKKISKKHKDIVFILDGEGEESGDIWRTFYLNGKMTTWRPTIEPPEWNDELASSLLTVDKDFER